MTLRHFFFHNFWIKLLSMALATVIWFAINYGIKANLNPPPSPILSLAESSTPVTINVLAQPGDARIFQITPKEVLVTVRGESAVLRKYSRKDFRAYIDLTTILTNEPPTQEVKVDAPNGLTIQTIIPRAVTVEQVSP